MFEYYNALYDISININLINCDKREAISREYIVNAKPVSKLLPNIRICKQILHNNKEKRKREEIWALDI